MGERDKGDEEAAAMSDKNFIKEIVKRDLVARGFDGLCSEVDCACLIDETMRMRRRGRVCRVCDRIKHRKYGEVRS